MKQCDGQTQLEPLGKIEFLEPDAKASPMYEVLTVKLNLLKHMKSKPRTPAYVEEVYHRIEVEMCTARNALSLWICVLGTSLQNCRQKIRQRWKQR